GIGRRGGERELDQVTESLVEIRQRDAHPPVAPGPLEARFPARGALGIEVRVSMYGAPCEVLEERRLLVPGARHRAKASGCVDSVREARAERPVRAELRVVIQTRAQRQAERALSGEQHLRVI